jgi:hypothetical protein
MSMKYNTGQTFLVGRNEIKWSRDYVVHSRRQIERKRGWVARETQLGWLYRQPRRV